MGVLTIYRRKAAWRWLPKLIVWRNVVNIYWLGKEFGVWWHAAL